MMFIFTASKHSDLDVIFGDTKTTPVSYGNGKYTRANVL